MYPQNDAAQVLWLVTKLLIERWASQPNRRRQVLEGLSLPPPPLSLRSLYCSHDGLTGQPLRRQGFTLPVLPRAVPEMAQHLSSRLKSRDSPMGEPDPARWTLSPAPAIMLSSRTNRYPPCPHSASRSPQVISLNVFSSVFEHPIFVKLCSHALPSFGYPRPVLCPPGSISFSRSLQSNKENKEGTRLFIPLLR
jgi:hypothetical protein